MVEDQETSTWMTYSVMELSLGYLTVLDQQTQGYTIATIAKMLVSLALLVSIQCNVADLVKELIVFLY